MSDDPDTWVVAPLLPLAEVEHDVAALLKPIVDVVDGLHVLMTTDHSAIPGFALGEWMTSIEQQ